MHITVREACSSTRPCYWPAILQRHIYIMQVDKHCSSLTVIMIKNITVIHFYVFIYQRATAVTVLDVSLLQHSWFKWRLVIRLQQSLITSGSFESGTHLKTGQGVPRNRMEKYCPKVVFPFSDCKNASPHGIISGLSSCDFVSELNERELILYFIIRPEHWLLHDWGLNHTETDLG